MNPDESQLAEILKVQRDLTAAYAEHGKKNGFTSPMQSFTEWAPTRGCYEITVYARHERFRNQRFDFQIVHPNTEGYSRDAIVAMFVDDMETLNGCKDQKEYMKVFYGYDLTNPDLF